MANYEKMCESILTLKTTYVSRYPKQIQLSEEFQQALRCEIDRFMIIDEDKKEPIRNFEEKFLKALKFEITEKCGKNHKLKTTETSKDGMKKPKIK